MQRAETNSANLAYDDAGSGETVVLLHGYPFNRSMWRPQVQALVHSYRVIAPDLRGHGDSEVAPATIETMARDVDALLVDWGVSRAVVAGLSMGGYVALVYYRLFRQRVRALILADTRAAADTDEVRKNRSRQADRILREGMKGIADELLPKLLCAGTISKRQDVVKHVRKMITNTKPEGAVAALAAMAQRQDQTDFLSRIDCPTLILVGRQDSITPLSEAERMHRSIEGSRFQVIEDAGHVSNLEQPAQFNEALISFLRGLT